MHSPRDVLETARQRALEITWWNRRLTKLRQYSTAPNLDEFLQDELIQTEGPFLEFVEPPAKDSMAARNRLRNLGVHEDAIDSLTQVLFKGREAGTLYRHQAEMIEAIESGIETNILTVPTATGKTESFLLPVLNSCVSTEASGLKALIVYPTKTLAVDQLNRIVSYLNAINSSRAEGDEITIGIWDGDTPRRVGQGPNEITEGSPVRGLLDPRSDSKLQVNSDGVPISDNNSFSWLKVTRDRIEEGVDILLTNPEAVDHLVVSNNESSRSILGSTRGDAPLQHIVYDEAHVWSGIKGAGIHLLNQRLKHFFSESDPQISLVSATLKNPNELAKKLTGSESVSTTDFTPAPFDVPETAPTFRPLPKCELSDIAGALVYVRLVTSDTLDTRQPPDEVSDALDLLEVIDMVSLSSPAEFTLTNADWLVSSLDSAIQKAMDTDSITRPQDCFATPRGREFVAHVLLDDQQTDSEWLDHLTTAVPELPTLMDWFRRGTIGPVGFRHLESVEEFLATSSDGEYVTPLESLLALGRLAGMVTDRHHAFLKPPRAMYKCPSCQRISPSDQCSVCECSTIELRFCKECHHPFKHLKTDGEDGQETFVPLSQDSSVDRCPDCDSTIRGMDVGVPTSSLLSYMLSEMVTATPSNKTLVFSDSHSAAESVAKRIQSTEYGLMAETLYVQALLEHDGVAPLAKLHMTVSEKLRSEYFEPFRGSENIQDSAAYNMIVAMRNRISDKANLYNTDHLLSAAIVTSDVVYGEAETPLELVIGHVIYRRLAGQRYVNFSRERISVNCLTVERLYDRVADNFGQATSDVKPIVDKFLRAFYEAGIVHEADFDLIRSQVNSQADTDEQAAEFREYLIEQGDEFADIVGLNAIESGLIIHEYKRDNAPLRLVPAIGFCRDCYTILPATQELTCIEQCPDCRSPLTVRQRFSIADDGQYTGDGVAQIDNTTDYALDHWAHDITRPLNNSSRDGELPFVTVGIHKGNIPATLRGLIEEGFRKEDPTINIVSSTPTMELGVDIGTLETVTQVGMPPTLTNYVQRAGRTGRSQGSSSLVTTVIRGQHPVDAHYYENLADRFFDEFDPVRVPEAADFTHIVAAHVVTEVFAYLARNPHRSNVFEKRYQLANSDFTAEEAIDAIRANLKELVNLITGEWESRLREHINAVFGQSGLEAFDAVFIESGSLNLLDRVEDVYGPLRRTDASVDGDAIQEQAGRLNLWLEQLGYLASYRSFGQDFPVEIEGHKDGFAFNSDGRLYDMFPGPANGKGAVFTLGGTDYIVENAIGGRVLTTTQVCTIDECPWPYQNYPDNVEECPHCGNALEETTVHKIESIRCREAYGGERQWTTSPLQTSQAKHLPTSDAEKASLTLFDIDGTLLTGSFEITDYVFAYERFHSSSDKAPVMRSEAEIRSHGEETPSHAPIGTQYSTSGIRVQIPVEDVEAMFETDEVPWPQILVSLQQASKRAIAIEGRFDLGDFNVMVNLVNDKLQLTVTDSRQGGTGVSWQLREFLTDGFASQIENIIHCDNCRHYCEECLLLPRTPASYLDNGLLDRQPLVNLFV